MQTCFGPQGLKPSYLKVVDKPVKKAEPAKQAPEAEKKPAAAAKAPAAKPAGKMSPLEMARAQGAAGAAAAPAHTGAGILGGVWGAGPPPAQRDRVGGAGQARSAARSAARPGFAAPALR